MLYAGFVGAYPYGVAAFPAVAYEEVFGVAFKTGARSSEGHHCPLPRHEERKGIGQIGCQICGKA